MIRWAALLLLAACATPQPPPEEVPPRREDVVQALRTQLDEVLQRYGELAASGEPGDAAEREALLQLAAEIAFQIVRVHEPAEAEMLLSRIEEARRTADG